ncbi:MAG: agmatinase [archaeon GW2011_AR3]|nr:MAG: agmatinase [archaeon GW2011_AR3]
MPCAMKVLVLPSGNEDKRNGAYAAAEALPKEAVNENSFFTRLELVAPAGNKSGSGSEESGFGKIAGEILAGQGKVYAFVGDHASSILLTELIAKQSRNPGLILIDAHPDCLKSIDGKKDWIRRIVDEGIIRPENILIVGARKFAGEEIDFLKSNRIRRLDMRQIFSNGIDETADTIMENARQWDAVQVSVDMDAIDPAFAPGVEAPEPGGLGAREIIALVQRLRNLRNIRIVDVSEVLPGKDVNGITAKLAAKIISEFA